MYRRFLWGSVLAGSALSLAGACTIAAQWLVIGSHEGGWFYRYVDSFSFRFVEPFLIAAVLLSAALAVSWPRLQRFGKAAASGRTTLGDWVLVVAWCLLAVALQALFRALSPFSAEDIFANDASNSFYSVALKYDARAILSGFEQFRSSWALHAQSNLPGKLLVVRALTHISTSPATLAWFVIVLSDLGGVLLFIFVRDLFEDQLIAALALLLYLFMPARLFFFPLLNTVTPVAVFACGCLLMRWLHSGKVLYAALLGVAVFGLLLFEPAALIIGVLFTALVARALFHDRITLPKVLSQLGAGVLAFAAMYLLVVVWFGFNAIGALRHVARDAANFNVLNRRPYDIWVRLNLLEFAFGIGLCQLVLFWAALGDGIAHVRMPGSSASLIVLVCLADLVMVGAADAIGVNRGEVIRLWIFLGCFCQIPAAYVCRRLNSRPAISLVLITALLQDALGLSMLGFIIPG